jgi:hypothetical protein
MHIDTVMKAVAISASLLASQALASNVETHLFGAQTHETCNCKNAADCTCPKGKCKCKNCGGGKVKIFESLKGAQETTRLPDTARLDEARAGVLI